MQPLVQFVSYDSPEDVGGVSSWLRKTVPSLREQGIDARVDLFCFGGKPGVNAKWYRANKVPVRWSPWLNDTGRAVQQCLQWLKEGLPQVYVPNCILPAYFAAAEAKRCGARTIGVLHSDDPFYWGVVDEFIHGDEKWRLSEMVVVSRFLQDALKSDSESMMPVHEVPYGVAIPQWGVKGPIGKFRLVYTGRLVEEQKRISDLARAFCRVAREHPDIEAWIVGAGAGEAAVQRIIREEGMEERVILKGRVDHEFMYAVLKECHAFVLLSDYEGTPVSLLEAMAVGLVPVCLNTRSGIGEVISHMNNGMVVQDREKSFSDAVTHLVENREVWSRMSIAARQTVVERYSDERCVAQWKQILLAGSNSLLTTNRPRLDLALPARNAKFGNYDQRQSPRIKRAFNRFHTALGSGRRRLTSLMQSSISSEK